MAKSNTSTDRRKARVRRTIAANAVDRPRLSVFRSSKQIYAQVIDDEHGRTLASASTLEKAFREQLVKAHLESHSKQLNAALNGANGRI